MELAQPFTKIVRNRVRLRVAAQRAFRRLRSHFGDSTHMIAGPAPVVAAIMQLGVSGRWPDF